MTTGPNAGKKFPDRKRPAKGVQQPHEWSEEEISRLKKYRDTGLSCEKIATQMSRDFKTIKYTKVSIIKKLERLNAFGPNGSK